MAIDITTGTIAAISNALAGIAGAVTPVIDDAIAQKYEKAYQNNIAEINQALTSRNPDAIDSVVMRLLSEGGQTIGGMGEIVGIRMDKLSALLAALATEVKDKHLLANIQFKQNTPGS